jgi:hypothetical protein
VPLQGDERIERAYWACVVALVPVREQLNLFRETLEQARGYDINHDVPRYLGFFIERAEVAPGKELEWQHVALYDGQKKSLTANASLSAGPNHAIGASAVDKLYAAAAKDWAGGPAADVVDERLANRVLTLPLPPLVGRNWGSSATHPKIHINPSELEEKFEQPTPQLVSDDQPTAITSAFGRSSAQLQSGPGIRMMGRMPNSFGYGPGSWRHNANYGELGTAYRSGPAANSADPHALAPGVDYYLLRFFDFTVQPGRKYKYRVKLALADPNYDMSSKTLAPAVLDRQDKAAKSNHGRKPIFRLVDDWSSPSPTVGIPIGGNIRLVGVKRPSLEKLNDEPSSDLIVEAFALDKNGNAMQAATAEPKVQCGDVINLVRDAEYLGPGYIDFQQDFRFFTGTTLVDMDGGTKLSRDFSAPSRVLLMGPAGQLFIHTELDDKPFVELHESIFEKPNPRHRGPSERMARRTRGQ